MKQNRSMRTRKVRRLTAMGAALVLVMSMGSAALAETEAAAEVTDPVATEEVVADTAATALTDEQKQQAQQEARAAYDAAVDEVLAEMVTAGALTQESVDSYHALREAERQVEQIDQSNWTLDQVSAYKQAIRGEGVNETTLAGLVSQGALTQADADAVKAAYSSGRVTISDLMSQVDTSKATQAMITSMSDARKTYTQALADAGILSGRGHGRGGTTKSGTDKSTGKSSTDATSGATRNGTKSGRGGR